MQILQPEGWGAPRGYANGIAAEGRIVFAAGQIGWNPQTCAFETDDFVGQVDQALRNVLAVLNKVNFGRNKYYYSRYYGHQYKNYYGQNPVA